MPDTPAPAFFQQQHALLDTALQAHLLALVGGEFGPALAWFTQWQQATLAHIATEDQYLLPHVPQGARWAARVYRLEHERIALLAEDYAAQLQAVACAPPPDAPGQRLAVLTLLDAVHALRHVLEHHHLREEQALAQELPLAVQQAAWTAPGLTEAGH
jgi:hypothetical protein